MVGAVGTCGVVRRRKVRRDKPPLHAHWGISGTQRVPGGLARCIHARQCFVAFTTNRTLVRQCRTVPAPRTPPLHNGSHTACQYTTAVGATCCAVHECVAQPCHAAAWFRVNDAAGAFPGHTPSVRHPTAGHVSAQVHACAVHPHPDHGYYKPHPKPQLATAKKERRAQSRTRCTRTSVVGCSRANTHTTTSTIKYQVNASYQKGIFCGTCTCVTVVTVVASAMH